MEIRKIKKEELQETMDLAWKVFLKFEAPDYPEEGVEEFRRSIYDPEFVSKLEIYGAFEENTILGMIATRNMKHLAMYFVDEKYQGNLKALVLFNMVSYANILYHQGQ